MKIQSTSHMRFAFALVFLLITHAGADPVKIRPAFRHLEFEEPLYLGSPPDGTNRIFVAEQAGRIHWFPNDPNVQKSRLALDISRNVRTRHAEEGLLGMAFHPRFKANGEVFLHYSASGPRRNVLSRFVMDAKKQLILPESEKVILEVEQPYGNHNGGMIEFGPDGYLYIALGDGGAAGDPHNNGQNKNTLLAKILRIDVDNPAGQMPYGVPKDNPFVGEKNARPEVWAWGLRNVWRFSFDRKTGDLWAGDVGQNKWEEINIVKKGVNYGWNVREGKHDFWRQDRRGNYEDPVVEHNRREAQSITGGYVYRGKKLPDLEGAYIYGDYVTGNIWALRDKREPEPLGNVDIISSFGEDQDGELYIVSHAGSIFTFSK